MSVSRMHDSKSLPTFIRTRCSIAGQEVEDAIVAFLRSQEQALHLGESVTAAARTVEITNEQYNQGAIDFTSVFVFQENLTEQQDEFAVAQGNIALSLIAAYRALGGGWQIRLDGNASTVSEPDTLERPFLEEMPAPGGADNDVEFQSFALLSSFMKQPEGDAGVTQAEASAMPATVNDVTTEQKSS